MPVDYPKAPEVPARRSFPLLALSLGFIISLAALLALEQAIPQMWPTSIERSVK